MTFLQIAVLLYVLFYYGILLGFRAYLLYRRTGVNAIINIPKEGVWGFNERVLMFCFILVSVVGFNYAFIPQNYPLLVPIPWLKAVLFSQLGVVIASFGLLFAFIAQLQMGDSWRLGIDENQSAPPLITHGLYRFSRNPVYLGILISLLGYFLMVPNAFSLLLLVLMFVSIQIKVRLEEAFLLAKHAESFKLYKQKVRRWF
jgi:protein-S-isoprenylcysteine O-methyltransferase Ste14